MKTLIRFLKRYWIIFTALIISFLMFYPALGSFFTHDDFYFLKISEASSFKEFAGFFNPVKDDQNIGVYRPLPLRVYYFLGTSVFNLNPLGLRAVSFITFFLDILLVGYLAKLLTKNNKISSLSIFLYAVSVTHFGQIYYVGAFQELLITLLVLSSVIFFVKDKVVLSFIFFILSLMCKETAVTLPGLFVLVFLHQKYTKVSKVSFKKFVISLVPFVLLLGVYLYLKFFHFGTIEGDSYIWDFSPTRAANTVMWYLLWSLNLPETLVDFIGPGLNINPNLMKYWSADIIPIALLFAAQLILIIYAFIKFKIRKNIIFILFCALWFLATISPVIFLPLHKFTYYLTLPLFGVVLFLAKLLEGRKGVFCIVFCFVWVFSSILTLRLTVKTNWITQGVKVSERVYVYFKENYNDFNSKNITFIDTPEDGQLPWSPTETLKTTISDKNFFLVFFPDLADRVNYVGSGEAPDSSTQIINSRQFLGY